MGRGYGDLVVVFVLGLSGLRVGSFKRFQDTVLFFFRAWAIGGFRVQCFRNFSEASDCFSVYPVSSCV